MQRVLATEFLDDPTVPARQIDRSLAYIRRVNRHLWGAHAFIRHLQRWSARWPKGRPITILDVATGSADIPLAARAWGLRHGHDLRITAIDVNPTVLDLARRHVASRPDLAAGIAIVAGDALRLTDTFAPESFDYCHSGMFLHHLAPVQVLTVLRIMDRLARAGIVWNDLVRSRVNALMVNVFLIGAPAMVRHDARVSVRAGFTQGEVLDCARRLGLGYARYGRIFAYRFTLAGEKPGAWGR